ncbi:hypothetical protein [Xanthomonas medicagonis]|uniref:hypothetical protein n=1 Tax=Xanthomonas medicagonis TaxID=3160841 RepID=UPI0035182324
MRLSAVQLEGDPIGRGEGVVLRFGGFADQPVVWLDRAQQCRRGAGQFRAQRAQVDRQQRQQVPAQPGLVGRERVAGKGDHAGQQVAQFGALEHGGPLHHAGHGRRPWDSGAGRWPGALPGGD